MLKQRHKNRLSYFLDVYCTVNALLVVGAILGEKVAFIAVLLTFPGVTTHYDWAKVVNAVADESEPWYTCQGHCTRRICDDLAVMPPIVGSKLASHVATSPSPIYALTMFATLLCTIVPRRYSRDYPVSQKSYYCNSTKD